MANYDELGGIIMSVIGDYIFNDQELCKLLYYNKKSENPLLELDIEKPRTLLMSNVFPLPKSPDAELDMKTILSVTFGDATPWENNRGFVKIVLRFDIMCHLEVWDIPDGLRPYKIASKIDKMFNNKAIQGLSDTKILSLGFSPPIKYSNYYYGLRLGYQLTLPSNVGCLNG